MHAEEPSLLDHLKESRRRLSPEGGVSFVIYAGTIKHEADMAEVLSAHRKVLYDVMTTSQSNIRFALSVLIIFVVCLSVCVQIVEDEVNNTGGGGNITGILIGQVGGMRRQGLMLSS